MPLSIRRYDHHFERRQLDSTEPTFCLPIVLRQPVHCVLRRSAWPHQTLIGFVRGAWTPAAIKSDHKGESNHQRQRDDQYRHHAAVEPRHTRTRWTQLDHLLRIELLVLGQLGRTIVLHYPPRFA